MAFATLYCQSGDIQTNFSPAQPSYQTPVVLKVTKPHT